MSVEIEGKSALQLARLLQSGALDAIELAKATLEAIDACPDKAIFTKVTRDRALAEAREAAGRLRSGQARSLLDGVPVAWKDLFDLENEVTTAGSRVFAENPAASKDAPVVSRLKQAGMISVGRLNMTEFAFSGIGINPHFGTPHNPRSNDVARIPGGSSSSSGVSVARGLVPVAIGTDTGGSVRIPAAYNGIVGYKSTRGRYPMEGVFPLSTSLDSLGPLCHTVEDAVWVDAAMRGAMPPLLKPCNLKGLRLIIPTNVVLEEAEPALVACFEAAVERLSAEGILIERKPVPAFDALAELTKRHGALVTAEAYRLHKNRLEGPDAARMDPRVVERARLGSSITASDYNTIVERREALIAETQDLFGKQALFAFPTVSQIAPALKPLEDDTDAFFQANARTLRNTALGNFLDWCGVTIPCGTADAGMPVGFLISAFRNCDEALLSTALATENVIRG